MSRKNAIIPKDECVACGCCKKVCPKDAIKIFKGLFACVDKNLCIGCQKCKNICPASIIVMEDISNEE